MKEEVPGNLQFNLCLFKKMEFLVNSQEVKEVLMQTPQPTKLKKIHRMNAVLTSQQAY
jgi:hypothetical protein